MHELLNHVEVVPVDGIPASLDPRLLSLIVLREYGPSAEADYGSQSVPVFVELTGADSAVPDSMQMTARVGNTASGTVSLSALGEIANDPGVVAVESPRRVFPLLAESVADVGCSPGQLGQSLPKDMPLVTGSGVIVGVIDYGLDLEHPNFRNSDGSSRVLALWHQAAEEGPPPDRYRYGREIRKDEIDERLKAGTIGEVYPVETNSHGTSVTDIAAGNGKGTGEAGIAPQAWIVFVDYGYDVEEYQSLCDSKRLYDAVDYIFAVASELKMPAVINVSLGMHGGPHDGTTALDKALSHHLETPGRAVVVAAGNSGGKARIHAGGIVAPGGSHDLRWKIRYTPATINEAEFWYAGSENLQVELETPISKKRFGPFGPGRAAALVADGRLLGLVVHRRNVPHNHDNQIGIFLYKGCEAGEWTIRLTSHGAAPVEFDAWIERVEYFSQQTFFAPGTATPARTLNGIACSRDVITVGAYDFGATRAVCGFSSHGPTRTGLPAPLIAAPGGSRVTAARSKATGLRECPGTSASAPHVSGVVALMFDAFGPQLTAAQIRDALGGTAIPMAGESATEGRGALDGGAAINAILASRGIENSGI